MGYFVRLSSEKARDFANQSGFSNFKQILNWAPHYGALISDSDIYVVIINIGVI